MTKTKLAVCIGDEVYQNRFVKCLMNHYQSQFEVSIFTHVTEILALEAQEYEVIIVGECDKEGFEELVHRGEHLLCLTEEKQEKNNYTEHVVHVEKYQEVYKIVDHIEQLTGSSIQRENTERERQLIGVFSLSREEMQLPFSATLCNICAESESVLFINTQPYSCIEEDIYWGDEKDLLEMEDLMAVATTGVYTKGRLLAGIGREQKWEYIHAIRNPENLAEGSCEIYRTIIDILSTEIGYKTIVLNFGGIFSGMMDLMNCCESFYLLVSKENELTWREKIFMEAMKRNERENFLRRVTRIEIPTVYSSDDWRQIAEHWRWNEIGELLQERVWMGKQIG